MNRALAVLLIPAALVACGPDPEPAAEEDAAAPTEAVTDLEPYDLEIAFQGLIAFVPTGGGLYALLPDADYDPRSPQKGDLPPCVCEQADCSDAHLEPFSPHVARLRLVEGYDDDWIPSDGLDITRNDLVIEGKATLGTLATELDILASTTRIQAALSRSSIDPALDRVDPALLARRPTLQEGRLGARVRIDAGTVTAYPKKQCDGEVNRYAFLTPGGACPAVEGVELGEEVVVRQENLEAPTKVTVAVLADDGTWSSETRRLYPVGGRIRLEIGNQLESWADDPAQAICREGRELFAPHFEAHRWFYRLNAGSRDDDCSDHYFPCALASAVQGAATEAGSRGGFKCPQRLMSAPE